MGSSPRGGVLRQIQYQISGGESLRVEPRFTGINIEVDGGRAA
jgi:hypothetical protein